MIGLANEGLAVDPGGKGVLREDLGVVRIFGPVTPHSQQGALVTRLTLPGEDAKPKIRTTQNADAAYAG